MCSGALQSFCVDEIARVKEGRLAVNDTEHVVLRTGQNEIVRPLYPTKNSSEARFN